MYSTSRTSQYASQLAFFLLSFGLGLVLSSLILLPIASALLHAPVTNITSLLTKPENAGVGRLIQGLGSILSMGIPALIFARLVHQKPVQFLGFSRYASGKQFILICIIILAAIMVGGALTHVSELIPIPTSWAVKFKAMEDDYAKQIMSIAGMKTFAEYLVALFILAFLPALTEELLFRGCLQQVLVGWTKSAFIGILITGIIFSAAHTSFYGFLPRLFLGVVLGYLFHDGKNLWLSIWAHFFNNALSLTQLYALSRAGKLNADSMNDNYPLYFGLIGGIAVVALFYVFRKETNRILAIREADEQQSNNISE